MVIEDDKALGVHLAFGMWFSFDAQVSKEGLVEHRLDVDEELSQLMVGDLLRWSSASLRWIGRLIGV